MAEFVTVSPLGKHIPEEARGGHHCIGVVSYLRSKLFKTQKQCYYEEGTQLQLPHNKFHVIF